MVEEEALLGLELSVSFSLRGGGINGRVGLTTFGERGLVREDEGEAIVTRTDVNKYNQRKMESRAD